MQVTLTQTQSKVILFLSPLSLCLYSHTFPHRGPRLRRRFHDTESIFHVESALVSRESIIAGALSVRKCECKQFSAPSQVSPFSDELSP